LRTPENQAPALDSAQFATPTHGLGSKPVGSIDSQAEHRPVMSDESRPSGERSRGGKGPRPRGRPRRVIDQMELLDPVERLFGEVGLDGISIERVAQELSVSHATLYRSVPSKEHLLGLLFQRMVDELIVEATQATKQNGRTAEERLHELIRVQVYAAVRTRDYLFVFFGGGWLPPEFYADWNAWRRDYELIWIDAVTAAADEGALDVTEPIVATRLLLGTCIWVSRWFRPDRAYTTAEIAEQAIRLVDGHKS
jgi:AcrR family transcriptional regulator